MDEEIRVQNEGSVVLTQHKRDQEFLPELLLFERPITKYTFQNEQIISQIFYFNELWHFVKSMGNQDGFPLPVGPGAQLRIGRCFLSDCWPSTLRAPERGALSSPCPVLELTFFQRFLNL